MRRYGLRDDQWDRLKNLLPGREGRVGGTAEDNRLFVEAVLYRFKTGCPWRDLPSVLAPGKRSTNGLAGGRRAGSSNTFSSCWPKDHDNEYVMIDATIVRAHQHSAGARKKTVRKPSAGPAAGRAPKSTRSPTR
jgi:transposase